MSLNTTDGTSKAKEEHNKVSAQNTAHPGSNTVPSWCIFVKTVGKGFDYRRVNDNDDDANNNIKPSKLSSVDGSFSFHVNVSPEDRIDTLHDEIEGVTGVKTAQQRLIYRGRLIGKTDVASVSQNSGTVSNENNNTENITESFKEKACQNNLTNCKNEQEYKIKDIVGLCDGQTIHLVRKRGTEKKVDIIDEQGTSNDFRRNEIYDNDSNNASTESEAGGGGGALLAALLGLETRLADDGDSPGIGRVSSGIRTDASNNNDENNVQTTTAALSPLRSPRASANVNNDTDASSRSPRNNPRPHYRLGIEDYEVADPGSMESVRQGLMTINTIVNSRATEQNTNNTSGPGNVSEYDYHPLELNREWFRGQWIDARDTVNQWLEATVVDILDPRDVLNNTVALRNPTPSAIHATRYGSTENQQPRQRRVPNVDNDPAISANDLQGRRRLLLEECEPGDPREIIFSSDTESDLPSLQVPVTPGTSASLSFRPRSSNKGVKLLLIHYNGWPHRWDEWIRSDSERLRPFRTRTRHPNSSSMASPTPQSIFNEAPRTNIIENSEEVEDRFAVLPELNVALSRVSGLLGEMVQRERRREESDQGKDYNEDELEDLRPSNTRSTNNPYVQRPRAKAVLPWMARTSNEDNDNRDLTSSSNEEHDGATPSTSNNPNDLIEEAYGTERVPDDEIQPSDEQPFECICDNDFRTTYRQGELRNLATLFDRLGRTLTDVAPHIASIAASLPAQVHTNSMAINAENTPTITESSNTFDYDTSSAPLGGLLSLWSRERERTRRNHSDQENVTSRPAITAAQIDPDHIDFASGIVNTTRGEVRSGPRNRSHQDDVASLLGTYLAAASIGNPVNSNGDNGSGATSSLARLLQRGSGGGSGDNGIDIHIHAIVTAPGVSPGGMGIATLSSGGSSPTATLGGARNIFSSTRSNARADGGILRTETSLSSNTVEPTDQEEYNDLFSELYSESPTPIDPNSSPVRGESGPITNQAADRNTDQDNTDNNCTPTNASDSIEQIDSSGDSSVVTSPSTRSRLSPRRHSTGRRSGVFRLFRRRGSRADNPDSNNEDS